MMYHNGNGHEDGKATRTQQELGAEGGLPATTDQFTKVQRRIWEQARKCFEGRRKGRTDYALARSLRIPVELVGDRARFYEQMAFAWDVGFSPVALLAEFAEQDRRLQEMQGRQVEILGLLADQLAGRGKSEPSEATTPDAEAVEGRQRGPRPAVKFTPREAVKAFSGLAGMADVRRKLLADRARVLLRGTSVDALRRQAEERVRKDEQRPLPPALADRMRELDGMREGAHGHTGPHRNGTQSVDGSEEDAGDSG